MRLVPVFLLLAACSAPPAPHGHDGVYVFEAPRFAAGESVALAHERPARRVGLRYDTADARAGMRVRVPGGEWLEARVVYAAGIAHNAVVELPAPARTIELEPRGALSFLVVELIDEVGSAAEPLGGVRPDVAPLESVDALVHAQSDWSQIDAGNCGEAHTPRMFTIHHTDSPNQDELSTEERLRQIQAFHRDVRGWCDIGYHFLVARDGALWRGRKTETRTGAHVADHNTSNVGVAFLGTFMEARVPDTMIGSAATLLRVLSEGYGVALGQDKLVGHRQWPSANTDCPGDQLLARLSELIDGAVDGDGDGVAGAADCDDGDRNVWISCGSCRDQDDDDFFSGCDAYTSIDGPDCDDGKRDINPAAMEVVGDGIDQNCNGADDTTCFVDADHDGYGGKTPAPTQVDCLAAGYSSVDTDCDDANSAVRPRALEFCDEHDSDCDGSKVDRFADADKDGLPDCVDTVFDVPTVPDPDPKKTDEEGGCAATHGSPWAALVVLMMTRRRR